MVALLASCGQEDTHDGVKEIPLNSNLRFTKEIFVDNLYEPTELVVLPNGKILFAQRRGGIKQYDPKTDTYIDYDSISVHFAHEDGIMGMAIDPDFEYNQWVYLYYSPPGEKPVNVLSRFSYTLSGLTNEVQMLEVAVQRDECCHTGGSVEFGPDGLLYLSTGDNTNPFESNGYSPIDERPGRSAWDARRSSANTNDLRGKILRIKPNRDGSYSIPEGNLFQDDDPLTRPEIYVMGCRNPYRIAVDEKRGWLFWGDVGADAGKANPLRGPRGHDEFNVATSAGNFGWPLFVGDNKAYVDYAFATGRSGELFDPQNPLNLSPNNTGKQELPSAQPAKIFYPYAKSDIFPQLGSGGRNAMAGPVYYADQYEGQQKYPSFFDGRVFFYEWMRGLVFSLGLDESGNILDWYPFMPETEFNSMIDMTFGPDGQIYFLEYGTGWFTRNENATLGRLTYNAGNLPPVIQADLSTKNGSAPLSVVMDASQSFDPEGVPLRFTWDIEGKKFFEPVVNFTFEEEGIYYPELLISDRKGNDIRKQFVVEVGNEPPNVSIEIDGNQMFFWPGREVKYRVDVSDLEDGKLGEEIMDNEVVFDIEHFQSMDKAEALGHQVPVSGGLQLIQSLDCKGCHKMEGVSIGPSYRQVAERYASQKNAVNYLTRKIINGGGGVWGEQAMSAHPDLTQEDAESIVNYILSIVNVNEHPLEGSYVTEKDGGRYLFKASYKDSGKEPFRPITRNAIHWLKGTKVEAASFDKAETAEIYEFYGNAVVTDIFDGSWIGFDEIDMTNIVKIRLTVSPEMRGGTVRIMVKNIDGLEIGTVDIRPSATSGQTFETSVDYEGKTAIFFIFNNPNEEDQLFNLETIEFVPNPSIP